MKEEQERLLRYIGELYGRRRMEKQQGKPSVEHDHDHDDIVKAGKKIRKVREQKKMDLDHLASITGLTANYIAAIEIGEADPYMTEIYELTKALNIDLSTLFEKE